MRSKDYLPGLFKEECSDKLMHWILSQYPYLSFKQARRVLCYSYMRLTKEGGHKFYAKQKRLAQQDVDSTKKCSN